MKYWYKDVNYSEYLSNWYVDRQTSETGVDSTTLFEPYYQQKDLHELTTLYCESLRKVVRDKYWKILVEETTRFEDGHATYWEMDLDQQTIYVNQTDIPGT